MPLVTRLLWPCFLLCHWLTAGLLAWHILAQVNFAYPVIYEGLDIEAHIAEFAPQNRHRENFHHTTPDEHRALFAQINQAIHRDPQQLANITYTDDTGQRHTLMHRDEIVHLQDVARLVDGLYTLGTIALGGLVITGALLWRARSRFPRPHRVAAGTLGVIVAVAALVLTLGPKRVFYTLHEWIFPPDHPWFFYYQDSLMTTLMKAPDLFGVIAIGLLGLWLLLWGLSLWLLTRLWLIRARR